MGDPLTLARHHLREQQARTNSVIVALAARDENAGYLANAVVSAIRELSLEARVAEIEAETS